jgi:hypothetical protein
MVAGRSRAMVHFLVFVIALGAILAIGSLNWVIALALLGFFLAGSIVALWTMWRDRDNPKVNTFPSQLSALPKKWQKWVLGESDDKR